MSEQDPNHQTTAEENVEVSNENFVDYSDGGVKLSVTKSCDDNLSETVCDINFDGLTKPNDFLVKSEDGLKEPVCDATGDEDEVEAGEISSPKGSDTTETFAVECELDFEDEDEAKKKESDILTTKIKKEESGEGADDGECTDNDNEEAFEEDLEEGELKDEIQLGPLESNSKANPPPTKTVCRFYNKGSCFYGQNCRFLHVNFLKTGNYSMFAPARVGFADGYEQPSIPIANMTHGMNHRSGVLPPVPPLTGSDFPVPPPQAPSEKPPAELETAWERALRDAKEMVKKANKRKVGEPDFNDKRLHLSLVVNEKNVPVENEIPYKKKKRENFKREYESHDIYNDGFYESRPHSREGHFPESIDMRYEKEFRRGRNRVDRERDKFPKSPDQNKERFRDDPRSQIPRSRVDDFFDPWRRSKSPKGRTRSRSGSFSSVSSYSYSSSRSSYTSSSTSPHPPHQKRTPSPSTVNPPFVSPKIGSNKFTTMKNKPPGGKKRLNSRSRSRTPPHQSRSRSRSFSRSISMDSVSSASSSRSSHSETGHQNSHASILRKQENPSAAVGEKSVPETAAAAAHVTAAAAASIPLPTVYLNFKAPNMDICKVEKIEETPKKKEKAPIIDEEDERDPLEEKFLTPVAADIPFPSLQHLLPTNDKAKEPFKGPPHKQQIKLTLLNKTPKLNNLPKKELDVNRKPNDEPSKPVGIYPGVKGPLSPPVPPVIAKPTPVLVPKKSASSRRDELLKQLKAVEDAIARKRAKFG